MKQETKDMILPIMTLIAIIGLAIYFMVYAIRTNEKSKDLKEELCLKYNFTYVDSEAGHILNDCYSIENGIIQYYNVRELNGTKYLMRGIR